MALKSRIEHAANSLLRRQERTEEAEVRRLAGILDELAPGGARTLLKSDTHGYDLEVFRGAREVLDRVSALRVPCARSNSTAHW